MLAVTKNEVRVIKFLVRNFTERYSINKLAKQLRLSPKGVHKMVKKLEKLRILKPEAIGNAIYYHPNLTEETGRKMTELVLTDEELNSYARVQAKDLEQLKPYTLCAVLFGSVLTKGKEARDIDVLLVFEQKQFKKVYAVLREVQSLKRKKIEAMVQSKEDLVKNIRKRDSPLLSAIRTGHVLWGSEIIVEAIKNGTGE